MKEIWCSVNGYEGIYQISNYGRVRSLERYVNSGYGSNRVCKGKVLDINIKNGYSTIGLCKNGDRKWFMVHRLVAEHFIPNPNNYPIINHKDEHKLNNCVNNLEWCTYQYNNTYGNRLIGWGQIVGKKLAKSVIQYDMEGNFIKKWDKIIDAERIGGFKRGCISNCCCGRTKSHAGYIWRYNGGVNNG